MPSRRTALLATLAMFGLLAVHAVLSGCDHDEIEHLHAAWLVSLGDRPYADFLEQHHPLLWYLLAPAARAFEGSPRALIVAARFLDLALLGGLFAAFLAWARPVLRDPGALWPLLPLAGCFFFLRNSLEVRPDVWMNALCVVALWQWSRFLRDRSAGPAAIAGLSLGLAIVFHQKALAFAGLLGLGTLLLVAARPALLGPVVRGGTLFALAALAPIGLLVAAVARAGLWRDFFFWNYTFNRYFYLETDYPGPSALGTIAKSMLDSPLLWGFGLAGLWLTARRWREAPDEPERALSAVVVVGLLASLLQSHWPFGHNLLLVQPPLALLSLPALEAVTAPRWSRAVAAGLLLLLAKGAVLCLVYDEDPEAIAIQRTILAETGPTDRISVPPPFHPIYRRDAMFFWYVPDYTARAYIGCCAKTPCAGDPAARDRTAWTARPPALVYLADDMPMWVPYGFQPHRLEYEESATPGLLHRTAWKALQAAQRLR